MLSLNHIRDRVGASIRSATSDAARWSDSPLSRRHRSGDDDEQRHGCSLARRDAISLVLLCRSGVVVGLHIAPDPAAELTPIGMYDAVL
jgi:hypothetical protein